ncbi:FAD binding domain-containing protein [Pseudonocardia kunmingensis]|uniref:Carbon-monoxide dehydrogenase medium subunit n=1 Tax=Pseudonocardia kunmingensis TaxID=630975 RepID=A0A543DNX5_9PSEU|nr:FAD binding domain-containing protein [Pseudonocardia kunmingensis]TQM11034.1 carbon-monoxide dehydrogenase medium subunit [Pseudonocardia kunmingensis]
MNAVLHRPTTPAEAFELLERPDAMVLSGGTAIQVLLKQGLIAATDLVDVARIPGLAQIHRADDCTRIGAMVSLRQVETNPAIRAAAPLLADTCGRVANPRVRNTASVAGNIAHGDYRLDPPTALMILDATVHLASARGTRDVAAREFFVGFQATAVERGELIIGITVPDQPAGSSHAYAKKSSLGENDWPSASAGALLVGAGSGTSRRLRLGLGALAPVPRFVEIDVSGLDRAAAVDAARSVAEPLLDPIPDIRGSESYKRRLGLVAVADAVTEAWR